MTATASKADLCLDSPTRRAMNQRFANQRIEKNIPLEANESIKDVMTDNSFDSFARLDAIVASKGSNIQLTKLQIESELIVNNGTRQWHPAMMQ